MTYDTTNIFAKILRGEIPCRRVYEDDFALAFHDVTPSAPSHILVVPKGAYQHYDDFLARATETEIVGFFRAVRFVAVQEKIENFRLITNNGEAAGQSVHHFHVHLLAGKPLGPLLAA